MNCPHCQQILTSDFSAANCPFCGKEMPQEPRQEALLSQATPVKWPKFFMVLFAPPVCCFIALALDLGILAGLFGIVGSLISGVVCTGLVMKSIAASGARRALLGIFIGVMLCGLSFFLSGLGCSAASSITDHGL
jgi:hypothetical protein